MKHHSTQDLCDLFGLSHQTVKNYTREFAAYLSPTATPSAGRTRQFTEADLQVFSLIVEMKGSGSTYEDIHLSLSSGQRGDIPQSEPQSSALTLRVQSLQAALTNLEQQLQVERLEKAQLVGQVKLLREMLAEAQAEIRRLDNERND